MKTLDRAAKIISWATIAGLVVLAILRHWGWCAVPGRLESYAAPVLTAAAVGYLTNWIAIWLLFKPYKKHFGCVQGVIPRNQERLGRELGSIIPEYLLKPDELADQLGALVKEYIGNPDLLDDIRTKVNRFLTKYSDKIAGAVIPVVEDVLNTAVKDNLTQEKLSSLYDYVVKKYLDDEANRVWIAGAVAGELQSRAPEITRTIKRHVRNGAEAYVREKYPLLTSLLSADAFAGALVDFLDWDHIGGQIKAALGEEETQDAIADELTALTVKLQAFLKSGEGKERLSAFLAENQAQLEAFVTEYLTDHLPAIVDGWLHRDELWDAVEHRLLPLVQSFILHRLKYEKNAIIHKFDLPGKIENSVAAMDMAQLHRMLLEVADNHLTAIQLLGYALGGSAGALLICVK